jgi:outer membrane cobalamin receptor
VPLLQRFPLLLVCAVAFGQQATPISEGGGKLLDILNTPITVASYVPLSVRESPGIVTLLRGEEIRSSGAKDLMEVLRTLAGFDFASDTQGVVGVATRGNFGHYGKVLLLVDGQEMNETQYGTTQLGWHYPISTIEKIEIIRGPGSVLYGGYAECAVIKVTSLRGAQMDGASASLQLSSMGGQLERQATVAYGKAWGDTDFSLSWAGGLGLAGQGSFPATDTVSVPVERYGRLGMNFLNLGLKSGGLDLRLIRDNHLVRDYTQEFLSSTNPAMTFKGDFLSLSYQIGLGAWTLKPYASFKEQAPWFYPEIGTLDTTRTVAGIQAKWSSGAPISLLVGAEETWDHSTQYHRPPTNPRTGTYDYRNQALMLQTQWTPGWLTLDLGARLDSHSQFGSVTSPRLAIMHAERDWHLKLIASGAFCAPAIAELRDNPLLRPERTTTYEVELGHRIGTDTYATANLFWIQIRDPISYLYVPGEGDVFTNLPRTGSKGLELESQTHVEAGWVKASLCYSQGMSHSVGDPSAYWDVPVGHPGFHVGLPNFKASLQGHFRATIAWAVDAGVIQLGPRYGYAGFMPISTRFAPVTLVNLFATYSAPLVRKLEVGFGITNLLGARNPFIQGYGDPAQGGNPPLPGPGREISLRVSYNF